MRVKADATVKSSCFVKFSQMLYKTKKKQPNETCRNIHPIIQYATNVLSDHILYSQTKV